MRIQQRSLRFRHFARQLIAISFASFAANLYALDLGVALIDVTPAEPIRLTGYGGRTTNSVGVEQKLRAKALAIGSDADGPALLLTLDNCGVAEETYREIVGRFAKLGVKQDRFAIACSHTHTGPCTTKWAPNIFSRDIPTEQQAVIDRYTRDMIDKLEQVARTALKDRRPGKLSWSQGSVGFARNRRVVVGNTAQFGENAAAPVDHSLPVLKVEDEDGKLRALVANYACHCTTLGGDFNKLCGDWAGFAQEYLERDHQGAIAMITIGCGADSNPSPRGGVDAGLALCKKHGEELAAEVNRLLTLTFTPLTGKLATRMKEIELPFGPQFTRAQWEERAKRDGIAGYHAQKNLARLDRGEKLQTEFYYPVVAWNLGDELALVFLPGEVVVDYALRLKREFDATRLWVTAYANYVPCYIPSRRILAEGGYEAEDSLWYYDRPARLSTNAEDLIIRTVHGLLPKQFLFNQKKAELPDSKTPEQALATFRTKADLTVELVASEPLIGSPVAIDWDALGRLWVCEMYDYPTGINPAADTGRNYGENPRSPPGGYTPGGRIKVLTDTDGDGRYDKSALFLDGLAFPTGVMPWRKGALICAAPDILYAEDTDDDGRADMVRTNYTGFATHNFQARVNGFTCGPDGWLHGSSGLFGGKVKSLLTGKEVDLGGRDFRIKPDTGEIEPLAGVSQMGRVRDDFDNWFGNDNSTLLWHYPLPDHYLRRNPHVSYPDPRVNVAAGVPPAMEGGILPPGTNAAIARQSGSSPTTGRDAPAQRQRGTPAATDPHQLFPISRPLERFNDPTHANRVTGACGPCIYRDVLLGSNYYGNAFICEPVHNLITRRVLEPSGVTFSAQRAEDEQRSEFLASTDNWFRPVQARTGPDGALWIVDMYRFVVEHPRWIPTNRLAQLDVRAGADMGRIYRVYPKGAKPRPLRDISKLRFRDHWDVPAMPDDWEELKRWATNNNPLARRAVALAAESKGGRWNSTNDVSMLEDLASDPSATVRMQVAASLGEFSSVRAGKVLAELLAVSLGDRWIRAAALSSAPCHVQALLKTVSALPPHSPGWSETMDGLLATALSSTRREDHAAALTSGLPGPGVATNAGQLLTLCSFLEELRRNGLTLELIASPPEARGALDHIRLIGTQARILATNAAGEEVLRAAAIKLLFHLEEDPERGRRMLVSLLDAATPVRVRQAALKNLRRGQADDTGTLLVGQWAAWSPSIRREVLPVMFERERWTEALLDAVRAGLISPDEIPPSERQKLLTHANLSIRSTAKNTLAAQNANRNEILANYANMDARVGVADRGAAVFEKNCAQCHACRGRGYAVGPNLAEFAGKSAQDFVVAILDPNSAINPNFLAYQIATKDGRSLSGIVKGETASGLTLVQGGGVEEKILRSEIMEIRASRLSLMPEGLEQAITPQDVADLIAWIRKSAPSPFGGTSVEQAAKARAEFLKGGANGLAKVVVSEAPLSYPSWMGRLPMPYCRQSEGQNRLVWHSPVRASTSSVKGGDPVRFRFPVAMGFVSQPKGKFTLKLNGKPALDFDVSLADQNWASADGKVRMDYTVMENNSEDGNGVLAIEVASELLQADLSAEFEVNGSASNSQRWFGLYLVAE